MPGKSDRPKCLTSVEVAKLYKTYFGEELETNGQSTGRQSLVSLMKLRIEKLAYL